MNQITAIQNRIHNLRGQRVMLDFDLAQMYGVETFNLNKAVKRNIKRFEGDDFMFQLTKSEWENLRFQIGMSSLSDNQVDTDLKFQNGMSSWGGLRRPPYAFTEQGVAMLSSVLRSETAINVNRSIIRAFVAMRQMLASLPVPDVSTDLRQLRNDFEQLKLDIEDCLRDQNDINQDTRAQLDAIAIALAELQNPTPRPRRKIGFVQD